MCRILQHVIIIWNYVFMLTDVCVFIVIKIRLRGQFLITINVQISVNNIKNDLKY